MTHPGEHFGGSDPHGAGAGKIRHSSPGFGPLRQNEPAEKDLPEVKMVEAPPVPAANRIRAIGETKRHEEEWSRTPNATGKGAIHVKTFHCKLTEDALRYMDQTVNEWLDAHPQYEVKFVNSTIGILTGKIKEPHLICQVWV